MASNLCHSFHPDLPHNLGIPMYQRLMFLLIVLSIFSLPAYALANVQFPLKLSENGRYLVDSNDQPFLIKEFSAWGLLQAISEEEEAAYLDSLKAEGFNTVLTSIVSNASSQMGGNPPHWQGVSPFNVEWDFSTPNEVYFEHVDRFLKMAEEKGFFVLLVPCYMGYYTDPGQGWWDEVRSENNSPEKMQQYGEFLGRRYRNTPNIMWVVGGDNDAKDEDEPYIRNMVAGIKKHDPDHLWTGHFCNTFGNFWSTDNPLYQDIIDIDGLYVWKEISLGDRGPQYVTTLEQYQKGRMIIHLDQSYEHDVPHYADNENPQWIRRKMYNGLLSGAAGTSFSSGTLDNQAYWFKNWQPLMDTHGMKLVANAFKLFDALPWHTLVPDTTGNVIIEGRGAFGSLEYITAAGAPDGSFYVMYIPTGRTYYVNIKAMSGKRMRVHWYNPRTGRSIRIGHVGGGDTGFGVVAPDDNDWLMIFDSVEEFQMP